MHPGVFQFVSTRPTSIVFLLVFHSSFFSDHVLRNKFFFLFLCFFSQIRRRNKRKIISLRAVVTQKVEEIETPGFLSTRATPTRGFKPVGRLGERETYAITASGYHSEGYQGSQALMPNAQLTLAALRNIWQHLFFVLYWLICNQL